MNFNATIKPWHNLNKNFKSSDSGNVMLIR